MTTDPQSLGERLKQARIAAQIPSARQAAEQIGVQPTTYQHHENGRRGFGRDTAEKYARRFRVNLEWLLTGRGDMKRKSQMRTLPLVGHVGAGAVVEPLDQPILDYVEVPAELGEHAEAVEVQGDSMWPWIQSGEVLIYDRARHDPAPLIGRKVVAKLTDGRMLVKLLGKRNANGFWTLISFNGPPMEDVDLEWVAEIRMTMRR